MRFLVTLRSSADWQDVLVLQRLSDMLRDTESERDRMERCIFNRFRSETKVRYHGGHLIDNRFHVTLEIHSQDSNVFGKTSREWSLIYDDTGVLLDLEKVKEDMLSSF